MGVLVLPPNVSVNVPPLTFEPRIMVWLLPPTTVAPPPARAEPSTEKVVTLVPLSAFVNVITGLAELDTLLLPSKTDGKVSSAAWILPCKICVLALQPIGGVVLPL